MQNRGLFCIQVYCVSMCAAIQVRATAPGAADTTTKHLAMKQLATKHLAMNRAALNRAEGKNGIGDDGR